MTIRSKLAVILHADVVGSTGLVRSDEQIAHERIQDAFRRFSVTIVRHGGIAQEISGDALVAEFNRASDAVSAALEFQAANGAHNQELSGEIRPEVRIGQPVMPSSDFSDKPSIAVLPFNNLSSDPEQDYFADGMTEDIITGLSKFRWLFVIARNSSSVYKGAAVDVKEAARELGVRYVLEGSIRSAGQRIRVTGQLIDAETANHLWAERYDRELDDLFSVQDEITNAIVQVIAPYIDQRERRRVQRKPPGDLNAWSLYQEGLAALYTQTEEGLRTAAILFDRSTARDPEFATAFAYAAVARNRLILNFGIEDRNELIAEVRERVNTALELDPWDAIALFAFGILASIEGNPELAVNRVKKSLTVNPNSAYIWAILGGVERNAGRFTEALEASEQAMRLSPRDSGMSMFQFQHSAALFYLERYEECVEWGQRATAPPAPVPRAFVFLAAALVRLDRPKDAARILADLKRHFPSYSFPESSGSLAIQALSAAGLSL